MERGNFIEVKKAVDDVTGAFDNQLTSIREAIKLLNDLGGAYKSAIPSQFLSESRKVTTSVVQQEKAVDNLSKAQTKLYRTAKQLEQQSYKESMARNSLNKQRERELSIIEKNSNAYVKVQQKINQLLPVYQNLQTKSQLGIKLKANEIAQLELSEKRLIKYREILNTVNKSYGNYSLEVGNYAKANKNLQFSIAQISRELPNFGQSFQIGVLSLTNNIGHLLDGISQVKAQNAQLKAEGKSTTSVFRQILSSLISWQTALFVGIGIFSAYSREIGVWAKSLFGAKKELDSIVKTINEYNKAIADGIGNSKNQINETDRYLKIATDETQSIKNRKTAVDQLRTSLSYWLEGMSDRQIMELKSSKLFDEINKKIFIRNQYLEKLSVLEGRTNRLSIIEEELRLTDISIRKQNELRKVIKGVESERYKELSGSAGKKTAEKLLKEEINRERQRIELIEDENLSKIPGWILTSNQADLEKRRANIQKELNGLVDTNKGLLEDVNNLLAQSIEFDYKSEKSNKEKAKATYEYIDALASEYRLKVLYYEREIEMNKSIFEDETVGYDQRAIAMKKMYDDQEVLSGIHRKEQLRLLEISNKEQQKEAKKAHSEGIIDEKQYFHALEQIRADFINNDSIINKEHEERLKEINDERSKGYDAIIKRQWEYLKNLNDINRLEQNRSVSLISETEQLNFRNILDDYGRAYENIQKKATDVQREAQSERIKLRIKEIDFEQSSLASSSEEYQKLAAERIQFENEINSIKRQYAEEEAQRISRLAQQYKSIFDGYRNEAISSFPAIQTLLSDNFNMMISDSQKQIEKYKTALEELSEGSKEYIEMQQNIADVSRNMATSITVTMVEAFQDMYNMLQQNSDAYYKRQFEVLEMQKDISIKFAGESVVAREEVERQYEERRKQIERQRAKQQKENAIFNAIINTAQAVVSTLASAPWPANIPMAALVGALGAAQIAMIASQPLPAYEHGTLNHGGGAMLINDGKGSNFKEKVITPDGKIHSPQKRNTIMNAPKGTMVLNHNQWRDFNSKVMDNGITGYAPVNSGITKEDLKEAFNSSYSGNREITNVSIDKSGINATIIRGSMKVKKLNNRIRIKSN